MNNNNNNNKVKAYLDYLNSLEVIETNQYKFEYDNIVYYELKVKVYNNGWFSFDIYNKVNNKLIPLVKNKSGFGYDKENIVIDYYHFREFISLSVEQFNEVSKYMHIVKQFINYIDEVMSSYGKSNN